GVGAVCSIAARQVRHRGSAGDRSFVVGAPPSGFRDGGAMALFIQQLINGISLGAIYGLIAIGYTMVYGIIGMINFAHGDIYMIGAFMALIAFLLIVIVVLTTLIMAGFTLLITRTPLGRAQRATEQDKKMASLLGVNVDRTISLTFVLGAGLAAVAGMMVLLYYGQIDFYIGFVA